MALNKTIFQEEKWVFDSDQDEALSLCDLPVTGEENSHQSIQKREDFDSQDFEFTSWGSEMCAADDVFFQGQILPLGFSFNSENGLCSGTQNLSSRSESMDRFSRNESWGSKSRSISSNSSSNISRSSSREARISNSFYMHPSPKPQVGVWSKTVVRSGRRSNGLGFFRLGLVRTPEIELDDLRNRKIRNEEKKMLEKKKGERLQRFFNGGFNCKCSALERDTVSSQIEIVKKRKEDEENGRGKEGITFEWLKKLSIGD